MRWDREVPTHRQRSRDPKARSSTDVVDDQRMDYKPEAVDEAVVARTLPNPEQPTRNWCGHCVRGRGISSPHRVQRR
eukprot:2617752-Amphidinium_carterae.1